MSAKTVNPPVHFLFANQSVRVGINRVDRLPSSLILGFLVIQVTAKGFGDEHILFALGVLCQSIKSVFHGLT